MDIATLHEPLATALRQALADMAATEVHERAMAQSAFPILQGELAARVSLFGSLEGWLTVSCDAPTGETLARRTLGDAAVELTPALVADCLGEITNVVAGQAKALLAETGCHFSFSTPTVLQTQVSPASVHILQIAFDSDAGSITLQLGKRA